jgi:hemoglobin
MNESLYERIGGAPALHKLVNLFYDIIENDPEGQGLNVLHLRGHGVAHSRVEQFNFLSGFLGGPQIYIEKHGHSNVREMHRHVEIGPIERDAWLACMSRAIRDAGLASEISTVLMKHFRAVANALEAENRANRQGAPAVFAGARS